MKNKADRFILLKEYDAAADSTLFTQMTIAAIRDCSLATIENVVT